MSVRGSPFKSDLPLTKLILDDNKKPFAQDKSYFNSFTKI